MRVLLTLAALVLALGSSTAPVRSADPLDINVLLSLTGPGAFLGQSEAKTITALEGLVNRTGGVRGRPVHFAIQDDQSSPQLAVQLASALIAKQVPIILGPSYSATCFAVLPLVKNGPVQYCYAPSVHTTAPSYTFSAGVSTKDLAQAGIRWFRTRGVRKIAVLVTTDATGQDGEAVVREDLALAENKGLDLVAVEHFNPSDISVNAQMSRIKASGAQMVIAWVTGTPFGTVVKGAVESGLEIPMLTNAGNLSTVQMTQYANFVPKELYFTGFRFQGYKTAGKGPVRDADLQFAAAMKTVGVANPDVTYQIAWDATMLAVDAFRHLPANPAPAQIRDYIATRHDYAGINGIMDFRDGQQRGYLENAAIIVRWDGANKDFVTVSRPGGAPLKESPQRQR